MHGTEAFVILGGSAKGMPDTRFPFTAWELSCLVVYMDLMVALLVVFHIGFLFRLPWLGQRQWMQSDSGGLPASS